MAGLLDAQKFAEELHWCISQLELGLQHQSPDSRQAAETFKVLKILKSSKAPLVKKRQAMRNALGDYRKKMQEAEKKSMSGLRHSRFEPPGSRPAHTKSKFLKVCKSRQTDDDSRRQGLHADMDSLNLQPSCEFDQTASSSTNLKTGIQSLHRAHISGPSTMTSSGDHIEHFSSESQNFSSQSSCNNCTLSSSTQHGNMDRGHQLDSHSASMSNGNMEIAESEKAIKTDIRFSSETNFGSGTSKQFGTTPFKFMPSDNSFRFGFPDPTDDDSGMKDADDINVNEQGKNSEHPEAEKKSVENISKKVKHTVLYDFKKSNGDFRFNFADSSEDLNSA